MALIKKFKILIVADSKIPVPPLGYGGTERMLAHVANELSLRGHEITLLGHSASRIDGRVVGYPWAAGFMKPVRAAAKLAFQTLFKRELTKPLDVVLANCRADYLAGMRGYDVPLIYRFSFPFGPEDAQQIADLAPPRYRIVAQAQSHKAPIEDMNLPVSVIGNCVDLQQLSFRPKGGDYLAFLGRLTWNKGIDTAIRTARATGHLLMIAGNISDEAGDKEFFKTHVEPQLDDQIQWVGVIGDDTKAAFLGGAKALLAPIRWPEPLANIVPEALACGTPVIAAPCGSMPELIHPGVNGYLATTDNEFVAAVRRLDDIDRSACRADAEKRFSRRGVVDRYLEVIHDLKGMR
jgi:glycosyltransferase involved in cell wall biosynthesis